MAKMHPTLSKCSEQWTAKLKVKLPSVFVVVRVLLILLLLLIVLISSVLYWCSYQFFLLHFKRLSHRKQI